VDDLGISASINGEVVQRGRTSQLIFPVPRLVEELSKVVELLPVSRAPPRCAACGRRCGRRCVNAAAPPR
ncbi:fumarylacetoacetate hydrolase family protein, partial [Mycobacterium sp. NAZ190054]|uniref:fumarylacetoacetate hydrolase family protein n=1 Tax=Mycobacterium sp. NAZ190054 TaxID=1747766 RepID=UPI0018D25A0A